MANFKLGDKVRIVKDYPGFDKDCEQSTVGKIGVIKGFHEDGDPKVFFEDIDDFWYYKDECLEIADDNTSPKYTYADVIIDPNDPRVEIGKEYWYGYKPRQVLDKANNKHNTRTLLDVRCGDVNPFIISSVVCDNFAMACLIRKKELTYTERQAQWIEANNIKVGDKVRVTRIARDYEDGWPDEWDGFSMNPSINKVCEIVDIHDRFGIRLHLEVYNCWFPYFVLEKVEESGFKLGDFVMEKDTALVGVIVQKTEEGLLSVYQNNPSGVLLFEEDELEHIKAHLEPFNLKEESDRNMLRGEWVRRKYNGEYLVESLISEFFIRDTKEVVRISGYGETDTQTLLDAFCFLDGSPCGLVVEDE